jgi:hypothetical protein
LKNETPKGAPPDSKAWPTRPKKNQTSKVKTPTCKTDTWGTQLRISALPLGHAPLVPFFSVLDHSAKNTIFIDERSVMMLWVPHASVLRVGVLVLFVRHILYARMDAGFARKCSIAN